MRLCNNGGCRGKKLLRAGILMATGTAIATVVSRLVSASETFFSVTRQGAPLEAKDKMRVAEDEG
jgi:hypothetical protein